MITEIAAQTQCTDCERIVAVLLYGREHPERERLLEIITTIMHGDQSTVSHNDQADGFY